MYPDTPDDHKTPIGLTIFLLFVILLFSFLLTVPIVLMLI